MILTTIFAVVFLASAAIAQPHSTPNFTLELKERVPRPRGWFQGKRAPSDHQLELRIALPQPNFGLLERHLYEISDPGHFRYGKHLSKEEVEDLVAPHPSSIERVNTWIQSYGFDTSDVRRSPAKDWAVLRVSVEAAERMLGTTFHVWTNEASGDSVVRTLSYSLPESLHEHVDLIQPTTMFARMKKQKTTFHWSENQGLIPVASDATITLADGTAVDAGCNTTVTITCLKQLYNAIGFNASAENKNSIGVTGYLNQFFNMQDLQSFYADQRPDALNSSPKFISVNGGQNSQNISQAGAEADLDVQFAFGLSFPTPSTFWSTAGMPPFIPDIGTPTDTNEPYTTWLDFILAQPNPPLTISTSYGDDEQTVPDSFATRVCNGFAQLGARGVSLMFSSGDGGVGDGDPDPATQECFTNDGRNVTQFMPGFPASCPFVTSVGGTINVPEVAVSFSGGGFSNKFPRPAYQDVVVEDFLKNKLPKGRNGRAIPDVSAQADNFRIFFRGRAASIGGTSASSPTFAGFVSLLNSARLSAGKPPLGFINPLLYSLGQSSFNDITVGSNPGCGTPGFNASVGWDPVTGFGTPNFVKLKELVLRV